MNLHKLSRLLPLLLLPFLLGGCQNKEEAKVQNAVTEYVDRGVETMEKADVAVEVTNEWSRQMEEQTKRLGE